MDLKGFLLVFFFVVVCVLRGFYVFYSTGVISLRILWPRNEAWILVAALFNSGSLKSISNSSATFLVISCISTSSGIASSSSLTNLRVKWPRKVAWIFLAASQSSMGRIETKNCSKKLLSFFFLYFYWIIILLVRFLKSLMFILGNYPYLLPSAYLHTWQVTRSIFKERGKRNFNKSTF